MKADTIEREKQEKPEAGHAPAEQPKTEDKPASPRKRRLWMVLGLVFLLVAACAGWLIHGYYAVRESTDDAQVDGHINPISARVSGTVTRVLVNDNEFVKAGSVLVQIDPRDYQVAVARAEAELADARANVQGASTNVPITSTTASSQLENARAAVSEAQAGIAATQQSIPAAIARRDAAQSRLREAEANAAKAAKDLDRYRQLVAKDEISRQQYDAAVAAAQAAQARVDVERASVAEAERDVAAAQAQLEQARARAAQARAGVAAAQTVPQQLAVTRSRVASAQARVQQAQAALEQAKLNLSYTTVVAPVDGVVSRKTVEVGQIIQPGQQLMSVIPLNDIWITANFKETQLKSMRVGQPAEIKVDAFGRKYRGHVDSIAGATGARFSLLPPENATGNFVKVVQRVPVKIVLEPGENKDQLLRPGMSVEPTVFTK
jgi:membrane fusion protein (multidrug efflux system)